MALCGVTHLGTTSMIFGTVALPLQEPFATQILMLCFVPVLTSDLLPIRLKSFSFNKPCASWYRTRHCLQELCIDPTRLAEVIDLLDAWSTKRHRTKRQLHSLLASLTLFSLCATPGERSYILCWMSSAKLTIRPYHLRWNHAFHKDDFWWRNFLPSWKGRSFFHDDKWTPNHILIFTPTHTSLASVLILQATGSTGHS